MLYFPALLIQDLRENRKNNRNRAKWLFACRPSKSVSQQVQLLGQQGSHRVPIGLKYMHTQRGSFKTLLLRLQGCLATWSLGAAEYNLEAIFWWNLYVVQQRPQRYLRCIDPFWDTSLFINCSELDVSLSTHCMQSEVMFGGAPI